MTDPDSQTAPPAPDSLAPQSPRGTLPAFAPVPRLKQRSNGWTAAVQCAFIEALADTGSVASACRAVARADHGAYLLRRHPEADEFRAAWDAALDLGIRRIEDVAMDRALNGVEVPVYSYGKLVGTRVVYNDRLLMFILRNRAPERFTEGKPKGLNAVDAAEMRRRKQQWRSEWEEEQKRANSYEAEDEVLASIDRKLASMRKNWLYYMSPRTRAAYDEFARLEHEDKAAGYDCRQDPEHPSSRAYQDRQREEEDRAREAAGLPPIPEETGEMPTIIHYQAELDKETEVFLAEERAKDKAAAEAVARRTAEPGVRGFKDEGWD
ncbi:hypothetical protein A9995_10800 [Erythrobacter sp. QSSC1-22B]|uniref:hypothetical protein n=1 Tax=Erythrobacter sp. QSSC1-22B TaxID=1860125 RepID=UPI00080506D0|nr:hypothetical protein [Erythrobacter sp. QSSC1-22B]OBX18460.1 hypothetical protein A9995_10800 [Erythrobacter sp. QSSC1-22B]